MAPGRLVIRFDKTHALVAQTTKLIGSGRKLVRDGCLAREEADIAHNLMSLSEAITTPFAK
jgi:hypothetical protein